MVVVLCFGLVLLCLINTNILLYKKKSLLFCVPCCFCDVDWI